MIKLLRQDKPLWFTEKDDISYSDFWDHIINSFKIYFYKCFQWLEYYKFIMKYFENTEISLKIQNFTTLIEQLCAFIFFHLEKYLYLI